MNLSKLNDSLNQIDPFRSRLPEWGDYILAGCMIIIGLASIILNSLVLLTIKHRKSRSQPFDVLILHLAVCDVIHGLVAHPVVIVTNINHTWILGMTGCKLYAASVFYFATTNIWSLIAISLIRFIKICHPDIAHIVTIRSVGFVLALIHLHSAFWAASPLIGWGRYDVERFGMTCSLDWLNLPTSYTIGVFGASFVLPLFIISYTYLRIVTTLKRTTSHMKYIQNKPGKSVVKMSLLMCICFMLTWTPYAVISFVTMIQKETFPNLSLVILAPYLAKSSSLTNPIVYFLTVKRFRQEMFKLTAYWFKKTDRSLSLCKSSLSDSNVSIKYGHKTVTIKNGATKEDDWLENQERHRLRHTDSLILMKQKRHRRYNSNKSLKSHLKRVVNDGSIIKKDSMIVSYNADTPNCIVISNKFKS